MTPSPRKHRKNEDVNEAAFRVVREATEGHEPRTDYPAFVVLHHLDELKVARAIRARPGGRLVVVWNGSKVTLEEMPPHLEQ